MAVREVLQHIVAASQKNKTKKDMCVLLDGECGLGDGQSAGVSTCRGLENKRMTVRMSLWRDTFDHPTSPLSFFFFFFHTTTTTHPIRSSLQLVEE
jgi:hypothetical protein